MACGLELRCPFLDKELVEFVASIPSELKMGNRFNFELKKIFKEVIREYNLLPQEVMSRDKQGFGAPVTDWLRGELKEFTEKTLLNKNALYPKFFNEKYVKRKLKEFYSNEFNSGYFFWKIINFELWLKEFNVDE